MKNFSTLFVLLSCVALPALASAQPDESIGQPADTDDNSENTAEEPVENPTATTDVAALRAQYRSLRDRLFQSRARAATVASEVFSSQLSISLAYQSARHYTVTRASIRLDGAVVFDDMDEAIAKNTGPRFSGYVAPGRHIVTIHIEAQAKDDQQFSTTAENSFVVRIPKATTVSVSAKAKDSGNIAYAWNKESKGSYQLSLDVAIRATKSPQKKKPQASLKPTRGEQHGAVARAPR